MRKLRLRGRKCSAEKAGLDGCHSPPVWNIRCGNVRRDSCGRHLHRIMKSMIGDEAKSLTVRALSLEVLPGVFVQDPFA